MKPLPHVLIAMRQGLFPLLFDETATARLSRLSQTDTALVVQDFGSDSARVALGRAEVLLTGWDCPPIDERVLAGAPALRAVIHAAGSVKHHITQPCWDRGLLVSSASAPNAIPVAEFTVAAVIMANKRVAPIQSDHRRDRAPRDWMDWTRRYPDMGNYRRTVGVIGCSQVGRRVIELLTGLDVTTLLYDPYVSAAEAARLGVTQVTLDELVSASDVVSLHAPSTAETHELIDRRRLALLRDGATLINTARGALVDTSALVEQLRSGRIHAVLDVTDPDPLPVDSPLHDLPNVMLTPHIAGSLGGELRRLGDFALDELERYVQGRDLLGGVRQEHLARTA